MFGRSPGNAVQTELYNGTSWTISANAATARRGAGGAGTQAAGLGFGGFTTTQVNSTEEFTGGTSALNIKTISTS